MYLESEWSKLLLWEKIVLYQWTQTFNLDCSFLHAHVFVEKIPKCINNFLEFAMKQLESFLRVLFVLNNLNGLFWNYVGTEVYF